MKEEKIRDVYLPKVIESKWQHMWARNKVYHPDLVSAKKPFYNLMMFPYPSAEGLHVGNMYAFCGADIYGRFKRMQGNDVFEPVGLDGFGIHSENFAIKVGRTPQQHSEISQENFYRQLHMIGNGFDWERKLETYDPGYYRWTQWLFIQLFKAGLAYRKKAPVNYCPSCKTVLADEQVEDGKCERCGSVVEKRNLEQWFFKITDYAEKLLNNIDSLDWSEKVKIAQKNWIGKSHGARIHFSIEHSDDMIEVFTTRPDTIFGATFLVVAPEHAVVSSLTSSEIKIYQQQAKNKSQQERLTEGKEKTGVFSGKYAINPATNKRIPIWIADYVLMDYGTGAIMAVPAHDKRDAEFATKYHLSKVSVIEGSASISESDPIIKDGVLTNSGELTGLHMPEDQEKVLSWVESKKIGKREVTYHLRDWLISRQRYWGPPIPMIYCTTCDWQPVPEAQLPVVLPELDDWKPTGDAKGPLAKLTDWVNTTCPNCGGHATRETDVSDSFLDSSWYFFRYTSTDLSDKPFDPALVKKWLPVNMYIGGAEHSVLHLLYARFITQVLHDTGMIDFEEPFTRFYAHGLLIKEGAKMSKSKGNIIVPDEYIAKFGADTLRCYLMFLGPFSQGGDFYDSGIEGMYKFLRRVYRLVADTLEKGDLDHELSMSGKAMMHKTIKRVTQGLEDLKYNTSIATLMEYYNYLMQQDATTYHDIETFLLLLAPFAPHMTEELWQRMKLPAKKFISIHTVPWPGYDEAFLVQDSVTIAVQVNGKMRAAIVLSSDKVPDQGFIEAQAYLDERIKNYLDRQTVKKIIYVPGKIINFVI